MIPVSEAQALILAEARGFGTEKVPLAKSFGRVLAQDVRADRDYPPFNRAMMDGYAVVAGTFDAQKSYSVSKTVYAGDAPLAQKLQPGAHEAIQIMTGAAVPVPFDAVIRKEDCLGESDGLRFATQAAPRWQFISQRGEDLKTKENISLRGRAIDNATASLLASLGVAKPQVAKLPRVAIISTGNEIIPAGRKPKLTQIRNANVPALQAQFANLGITQIMAKHSRDDRAQLRRHFAAGSEFDILIVTGGVSEGVTDYVPAVLAELKFRCLFHKVQIKPGKPLWFGRRGRCVVFAIPGNPLSCQVIFRVFIEPFLRACFSQPASAALRLPLAGERRKKDSLEHFFPVRIESALDNGPSLLSAMPFNGSGDVRAALSSDGIARHAGDIAALAPGTVVDFFPWRAI